MKSFIRSLLVIAAALALSSAAHAQCTQMQKVTVATLPSATSFPTCTVQVVDGSTPYDCKIGGGISNVTCIVNGGAWTAQWAIGSISGSFSAWFEAFSGVSGATAIINSAGTGAQIGFNYSGGTNGVGSSTSQMAYWGSKFPGPTWILMDGGNHQINSIQDFGNFISSQVSTPQVPGPNAAWSTSTTGGTLAASTTYYYRIEATQGTDTLFTVGSTEASITTGAGSTNKNTVTFAVPFGATGFDLYRGTSPGGELKCTATPQTIAQLTEGFIDTGVTCAGSAPHTVNTTGGGVILQSAAPTVTSGRIGLGGTTAAASNCGSLAGAAGCVVINVSGTTHYVPYY